MKLGVLTNLMGDKPLEEVLAFPERRMLIRPCC